MFRVRLEDERRVVRSAAGAQEVVRPIQELLEPQLQRVELDAQESARFGEKRGALAAAHSQHVALQVAQTVGQPRPLAHVQMLQAVPHGSSCSHSREQSARTNARTLICDSILVTEERTSSYSSRLVSY